MPGSLKMSLFSKLSKISKFDPLAQPVTATSQPLHNSRVGSLFCSAFKLVLPFRMMILPSSCSRDTFYHREVAVFLFLMRLKILEFSGLENPSWVPPSSPVGVMVWWSIIQCCHRQDFSPPQLLLVGGLNWGYIAILAILLAQLPYFNWPNRDFWLQGWDFQKVVAPLCSFIITMSKMSGYFSPGDLNTDKQDLSLFPLFGGIRFDRI